MEERPLLTALLALLLLCPAAARGETSVAAKKKNLEEINRQLEDKKKELDQYKAEEERIIAERISMSLEMSRRP